MSKKIVDPSLFAEINKAVGRTVENPIISFDDAVSTFLDFAKMCGLSEHTVSSYAKEIKVVRSFLVESDIELDDITKLKVEHYEDFIRKQLEQGYANPPSFDSLI